MSADASSSVARYVSTSIAVLLVGVPLAYSSSIFDAGLLPKHAALTLLLIPPLLCWVYTSCMDEASQSSPLDIPVALFWLVTVLQWPRALDSHHAALDVARTTTLAVLYLVVSRSTNRDAVPGWLRTGALVGFAVSAVGILQYLGWGFLTIPSAGYPSGTFPYRNLAAMYVVAVLPFSVLRFLEAKTIRQEVRATVEWSVIILFLLYTRTRGAWLGATLSLVLAMALYVLPDYAARSRHLLKSLTRLSTKSALVVAASLVVGLASGLDQAKITQKVAQSSPIPEKKETVAKAAETLVLEAIEFPLRVTEAGSGRFGMWSATLQMIGEYPLAGVGLNNWEKYFPNYKQSWWTNHVARRPHNDYLWVWAELGPVGIVAYLSIFIAASLIVLREARSGTSLATLAIVIFSSIVAVQTHGFFSFPRERVGVWFITWFGLGVLGWMGARERGRHRKGRRYRTVLPSLALVLTILTGALIVRAASSGILTTLSVRAKGTPLALDLTRRATKVGTFDYLHRMYHADIYVSEGELEPAYQACLDAYRRNPSSQNTNLNLNRVVRGYTSHLERVRQYERILEVCDEIADIYPEESWVPFRSGRAHHLQGDLASAREHFERALELWSSMPGAHIGLGDIALKSGDSQTALRSYLKGLKRDSLNARTHLAVGAIYLSSGETAHAKKHLTKARRLASDSGVADKAEKLLVALKGTI